MDENGYTTSFWKLSVEGKRLLTMSALPLLDGFFIAYLATNLWKNPLQAFVFGLTAFSGAGCVVAAIHLQGKLKHRIFEVCKVYIVVGIGAIIIAFLQPFFSSILPENMHLFTGIFLIGLGLWTSKFAKLQMIAKWMSFDSIIKIVIIAAIINGLFGKTNVIFQFNLICIPNILIMLASAFSLTIGGMFLGITLKNQVSHGSLNIGAGISLIMMGLTVFGLNIPAFLVVIPLVCGCILTIFTSVYSFNLKNKNQNHSSKNMKTDRFWKIEKKRVNEVLCRINNFLL